MKATITMENMDGVSTSLYKSGEKGSLSRQIANKIGQNVTLANTKISKAAEWVLKNAGLKTELPKKEESIGVMQAKEVITVQYNPTSIKMSSHLDKLEGDSNKELNQCGGVCLFDFSVSLIFSSRYPTDTSVSEQVERFMAFMLTSQDRKVTFAWGNYYFQGLISNLNANFLQFERTGNPTYATVDISIEGVLDEVNKKFENIDKKRNNKEVT